MKKFKYIPMRIKKWYRHQKLSWQHLFCREPIEQRIEEWVEESRKEYG